MEDARKKFINDASKIVKDMSSVSFTNHQARTKFLAKMFDLAKSVMTTTPHERVRGLGITHPNSKGEKGQTIMTEGMSMKGDKNSPLN